MGNLIKSVEPQAISEQSAAEVNQVQAGLAVLGRRMFDIGVALAALILFLPLFILLAVLIKLDTPGPVFFRQMRVGLRRRHFLMWKFRKMPADLADKGPSLTVRY